MRSPHPFLKHRPIYIPVLVRGRSGVVRVTGFFTVFNSILKFNNLENGGPGGPGGPGGNQPIVYVRARACLSLFLYLILYKSTQTTRTKPVMARVFTRTTHPDHPGPPGPPAHKSA